MVLARASFFANKSPKGTQSLLDLAYVYDNPKLLPHRPNSEISTSVLSPDMEIHQPDEQPL
jgi:hypothetical protein